MSQSMQTSKIQQEISLGKMDFSTCGTSFTDMVSDSRYPQTVAGLISVSASCFSAGLGIYRLAAGLRSFGFGL